MSDARDMFILGMIAGLCGGLAIGVSVAHYTWSGDAERQQQVHRLKCAQHTNSQASLEWCLCGRDGCE